MTWQFYDSQGNAKVTDETNLFFYELQDVNVASAASGQGVVFNGSTWQAGIPELDLNDVQDVSVASAASGNVLIHDGSGWVAGINDAVSDEAVRLMQFFGRR